MADSPGRTAVPGATVEVIDTVSRQASPLPFYLFEVYAPRNDGGDGANSYTLASSGDLGGVDPQVMLRIPPGNMRITSPIRAEASLDILGGVTVAQGGLGLRRWTLSGTHGVGIGPQLIKQAANGEVTMSAGYAVRLALATLFEAWVKANDKRRKEQRPMLRMLFAIRGGTLTEFQNEEWWIQPDGLPEETRSIARPLAWDWSLSFMALMRFREELAKSSGAEVLMPPSAREVLDSVDASMTAADKVIQKAQQSKLQQILANASSIKVKLQSIRDSVSSAVSTYRNTVSGVAGYVYSCSQLVDEALLLVDRSNLFDQPARELYNSLMAIRHSLGYVKMLGDGYLEPFTASSVRPPTASVQLGDTLQSIAAREFGDAGRWHELAALNGLTYPFLDFSGPNGAPDPRFLGAGKKVLGTGESLNLPNAAGQVPSADPIGTDLTDAGTKGTLVGGIDNLRAAMLRRLRTPKGYLPHHPEYGSDLPTFVGRPMTPALVLAVRGEVDRVLREDPRVISVQSVGIAVLDDSIWVDASATTVLGPVSISGPVGGLMPA